MPCFPPFLSTARYPQLFKLNSAMQTRTKLVFVGDVIPFLSTLQQFCAQLGVVAIFMGQRTGAGWGTRWGVRLL
jgi:hypothetical protein